MVLLTACPDGCSIQDVFAGNYTRELSSEAQELNIEISTVKGDSFYLVGIYADSYNENGEREGESINLHDLEYEKIVKGPWFEVIISDDFKFINIKLEENTTTFLRHLGIDLSNEHSGPGGSESIDVTQEAGLKE